MYSGHLRYRHFTSIELVVMLNSEQAEQLTFVTPDQRKLELLIGIPLTTSQPYTDTVHMFIIQDTGVLYLETTSHPRKDINTKHSPHPIFQL